MQIEKSKLHEKNQRGSKEFLTERKISSLNKQTEKGTSCKNKRFCSDSEKSIIRKKGVFV